MFFYPLKKVCLLGPFVKKGVASVSFLLKRWDLCIFPVQEGVVSGPFIVKSGVTFVSFLLKKM